MTFKGSLQNFPISTTCVIKVVSKQRFHEGTVCGYISSWKLGSVKASCWQFPNATAGVAVAVWYHSALPDAANSNWF